jgi:hypothetical protein
MANLDVTGTLIEVQEVKVVSDKFKTRSFVLQVQSDKPEYSDFLVFQLSNDNCVKIDGAKIRDVIEVKSNIRGRMYTTKDGVNKYFNTLDCWSLKIEKLPTATDAQPQTVNTSTPVSDATNDLPF